MRSVAAVEARSIINGCVTVLKERVAFLRELVVGAHGTDAAAISNAPGNAVSNREFWSHLICLHNATNCFMTQDTRRRFLALPADGMQIRPTDGGQLNGNKNFAGV
jgi:hypothetical protein